jgi:prolyl-tRNA synthetase
MNFVAGSNTRDEHLVNVNLGRDFTPALFADIRQAVAGDLCTRCMAPLEFDNAFEVGQLYKLGTTYSGPMGATFVNDQGQQVPLVMGSYGIGINRIIGSAIELHHDERGIIWPLEIAPYQAVIVAINPKDPSILNMATKLYEKLLAVGVDVLLDDRDQTAGVKFADSDLIGFPVRVTVGSKTIAEKSVDIKLRNKKEQTSVGVDVAVESVGRALEDYE